ncbi:MAG: YceI family protein [Opitutae bacterium]|nr:YceI family protein [Opitutae bacterium]
MKSITTTITILSLLAVSVTAKPVTFDMADKKGVNSITFAMDSLLEPIYGNAAGITGKVSFDPDTPEKTSGKVVLKTASLHVANKLMKEHIHGDGWMNVVVFPSITFNLKKLTNVKKDGDTFTANAVGTMTILKVTREITAPVTISFLKGRLAERNRVEGDLLVVRSKFQVKRGDFGINPGQKLLKVANEIDIRVGLAGAAPY